MTLTDNSATSAANNNVRLEPGAKAPDFTLLNDKSEEISLSDFAGSKVLLYFYPRANTPGCTTEACDFRDESARFNESSISVVGVSPDKPEKLAAFREDHGLEFELLSDPSKETLAAYGAFGEKKNYGKIVQGIIRSTVLIDETGSVAASWYNVRAKGHVGRVLRELDELTSSN